jgi:hypothetical protein
LKNSSLADQPLTTSKKVKVDFFPVESAKTGYDLTVAEEKLGRRLVIEVRAA